MQSFVRRAGAGTDVVTTTGPADFGGGDFETPRRIATIPVRTTSTNPNGLSNSSKRSTFSSPPVNSTMIDSAAMSSTFARNTVASSRICERVSIVAFTLIIVRSRISSGLVRDVVDQQHVHELVDVGDDPPRLILVRIA